MSIFLAVLLSLFISGPATDPTHNDRAYMMAARAIATEAQHHTFPPSFIPNAFEYGAAVYRPGVFVGLEWLCDPLAGQAGDGESCYAGLIWQDGQRIFQTGP